VPIPTLKIEDPDLGLPRQPVPLRYAYLVVGLPFRHFLGLLAVRHFDRYELLTAYEFRATAPPGKVPREFYEQLATNAPLDEPEGKSVARLPPDHFAWSDELARALPDYIDHFMDRVEIIPSVDFRFEPASDALYDLGSGFVNRYTPSPYRKAATQRSHATIPPNIGRVVNHALGGDVEADRALQDLDHRAALAPAGHAPRPA
jgi:hypothetical protein